MTDMYVTKRDGSAELWDSDKVKKTIKWGVEGVEGVDALQLENKFYMQVHDKIPTVEIIKYIISSALKMVSTKEPNWILVAGRLANMDLNKIVRYNLSSFTGESVRRKFGYGDIYPIIKWYTDNDIWDERITNTYDESVIKDIFSIVKLRCGINIFLNNNKLFYRFTHYLEK